MDIFVNCSVLLRCLDAHLFQVLGVEQVHLSRFHLGIWALRSCVNHIYCWLNIKSSCNGTIVLSIKDILLVISWTTLVEVGTTRGWLVLVYPIQISHQLAWWHLKRTLAPSSFWVIVWKSAPSMADLSIKKHLWHRSTVSLSRSPKTSLLLDLLSKTFLRLCSLSLLHSFVLIILLFLLDRSVFIGCRFLFILCLLFLLFIYLFSILLSQDWLLYFRCILWCHLNLLFLIWHLLILNLLKRFIVFHFIHDFSFEVILAHVSDVLLRVSSFDSVDNWFHVAWGHLAFETGCHACVARARISSDAGRWWEDINFFSWRSLSLRPSSWNCIWIFCIIQLLKLIKLALSLSSIDCFYISSHFWFNTLI